MRENTLRTTLETGGTAFNGWLHIPSTWSAEVMANVGWDSLTVDMQHGMMGLETTIQMLQAISTTPTTPIVRVNWNEPGVIMKVLDAGAYGVICPMVNTRQQCEAFVGAVRYPPQGYRSLGPTRARVYAGPDYADHANDTLLAFAMVETAEAMDNLNAIAATPGLNGIFVGAGDLRLSVFGEVGLDGKTDEFQSVLQRIVAACHDNDIIPGIFTASPHYAQAMQDIGFRFITVKTDTMILSEGASNLIQASKSQLNKQE
jgi:4-hydroxy-2-oxoheptanedioate aldolase